MRFRGITVSILRPEKILEKLKNEDLIPKNHAIFTCLVRNWDEVDGDKHVLIKVKIVQSLVTMILKHQAYTK